MYLVSEHIVLALQNLKTVVHGLPLKEGKGWITWVHCVLCMKVHSVLC